MSDADMLREVRAMRQRIKRVADQISRAADWHDTDPLERKQRRLTAGFRADFRNAPDRCCHFGFIILSNGASRMTADQYRAAIERLGLSQRAAGAFLGVDERQSRRWIAGDARIPEAAAKLLRLLIRLKINLEDIQ